MPVPMSFVTRLLRAPDLIQFGARTAVRKNITSNWDYEKGTGLSKPPVQIDIKLVDQCNLRCKMCPQWGDAGYNFDRPSINVHNVVPLSDYERLCDEVASFKPWIFLWGGEPMLYPDILPLVHYIKGKGMPVSIITNGTMTSSMPGLVEANADVVLFSIDGPRDTHDCIRGYKGAFDKAMISVRTIISERERRKRVKPFVVFTSVITAENQRNLHEVYELAAEMGADMVLSVCNWFQTPESGRRQTEIMEEKMGITPWAWKGYVQDMSRIDPAAVRATVQRIKARKWPFFYKFYPAIEEDEIEAFFRDHSNTFGNTRCTAPWAIAEILPNGDIANCRDYPDVVAGNIRNASFLEIWNKGRLVHFRRLLIEQGGALPICSRCHGLMGC